MKNLILFCFLLIGISCQNAPKEEKAAYSKNPNEINFYTSDSIQIFGDLYQTDKTAATILLFHQGGSNARAEYKTIVPILTGEGFNVLTIDQRRGGQRMGNYNRTVAAIPQNRFSYCDAYPDLDGALSYIISAGFTGNKIVWGSSYSASLAIQLAANRPDEISAILSFSPASGEPLKDCNPNELFETLKTPLLVLRPKKEMEIESVQIQFALAQQFNHQAYVAENGVHGSSMLVEERVKADVSKNWETVWSFIKKYTK